MGSPTIFNGLFVKTLKSYMRMGSASADPASPALGDYYFKSTDNTFRYYNGTSFVTPSVAASGFNQVNDISFVASVASNALTIAIKDGAGNNPSGSTTSLGFRSATLTSGAYVFRSIATALSMTVSSGSTLGHANGVSRNIWLYLIDNAGTVEVAVSSALFDETSLYSTVAEGGAGAADSESVLYSTTARTGVAIRLIGRLLSNQTTAGAWAVVPIDVSMTEIREMSVAALYTGAPPTGTLNGTLNTVTFGTKVTDTRNAYSGGAYTVPETGTYSIAAIILVAATYAGGNGNGLSIFIEGVEKFTDITKSALSNTVCRAGISIHGIYLTKNQSVTIRAFSDGTTPTYVADAHYNYFSIARTGD